MTKSKKIIYFLCTGNSCRSQMAEGFGKKYIGDRYEVYSAGIEAHGVNPLAVIAMAESDVDLSGQTSNVIDLNLLQRADVVITLCGNADERCPQVPLQGARAHWGFDDPAKATGTPDERWEVFRRVRDEIEARIQQFAIDELV